MKVFENIAEKQEVTERIPKVRRKTERENTHNYIFYKRERAEEGREGKRFPASGKEKMGKMRAEKPERGGRQEKEREETWNLYKFFFAVHTKESIPGTQDRA